MFRAIGVGIKRFISDYLLAILIATAALAVVAITTRMNQMAGIAQAATKEGQDLFGWANIAVHVVGVVLCGIVGGVAAKHGYRRLAQMMAAIVAVSALCSALAIMGFLEIETLSVTRSRQAQIEQNAKDAEARRQAAARRLDIQADLAKEQLKLNRVELAGKSVGRKERTEIRRDMNEASRALIADIGKEEIATEPKHESVLIAPVSGSQYISTLTFGLVSVESAANFRLGLMTIILLVLEVVLWPTAGYCWGGFGASQRSIVASPSPDAVSPVALAANSLPEPEKSRLALPKPAPAARPEPAPEWRAMLDLIDFPKKKMLGARRPRDKREVLGLRFLTWLCAFGHTGEFTADQIDKLYEDFAAADNREEWATRIVKAELRDAKKWVQVKDSRSPTMWIIASPPIARLKDLLAKRKVVIPPAPEAASPDPKQEAGQGSTAPFVCATSPASGASAPPAPANENRRGPIKGWAELQRLLPDWERSLRALVRQDKAAWQQRFLVRDRKQGNRFRRSRAA